MVNPTIQRPVAPALNMEQCMAIYKVLNGYGKECSPKEFGLPMILNKHNKTAIKRLINAAIQDATNKVKSI